MTLPLTLMTNTNMATLRLMTFEESKKNPAGYTPLRDVHYGTDEELLGNNAIFHALVIELDDEITLS